MSRVALHKVYEKIKTVRRFIRAEFLNVFCQYVFETGRHNGVRELDAVAVRGAGE